MFTSVVGAPAGIIGGAHCFKMRCRSLEFAHKLQLGSNSKTSFYCPSSCLRAGSFSVVKAPKVVRPSYLLSRTTVAGGTIRRNIKSRRSILSVIVSFILMFRPATTNHPQRKAGHMKHTSVLHADKNEPNLDTTQEKYMARLTHRPPPLKIHPVSTTVIFVLFVRCRPSSTFCDWIGMYIDMLDGDICDRPLFLSNGRLLHHVQHVKPIDDLTRNHSAEQVQNRGKGGGG